MTSVLSQAFLAAGIPGTVTLLQGSGLMSAVPLMYWFIPRWGLKGAAYALLLSTAVRLTLVVLNYPLRLKMMPPRLLLTRSDFSIL